jgi:hypothetical protein
LRNPAARDAVVPLTPRTYGPADPLSASKDSVLFAASLTPKAFDIDVGNIGHVALDSSLTTETLTLVSDKCETTSGVAIAAAPMPLPCRCRRCWAGLPDPRLPACCKRG